MNKIRLFLVALLIFSGITLVANPSPAFADYGKCRVKVWNRVHQWFDTKKYTTIDRAGAHHHSINVSQYTSFHDCQTQRSGKIMPYDYTTCVHETTTDPFYEGVTIDAYYWGGVQRVDPQAQYVANNDTHTQCESHTISQWKRHWIPKDSLPKAKVKISLDESRFTLVSTDHWWMDDGHGNQYKRIRAKFCPKLGSHTVWVLAWPGK